MFEKITRPSSTAATIEAKLSSASTVLSVLLPNMFDQVAVGLLLLAGITFVYVIGIGQSHPHDRVDKKGRSTEGAEPRT